jgi:hypothetical protein
MCVNYKLFFGNTTIFMHNSVLTAIPAVNTTFSSSNMMKAAFPKGVITAIAAADVTTFSGTFPTDKQLTFVCVSDMATMSNYTVTIGGSTAIGADSWTAPAAPAAATSNYITFNSTLGNFAVGVNAVATGTATNFTVGDVIRITVVVTSTVSGLKAATSYTMVPQEFIAAAGNVVAGQLTAAVTVTPQPQDAVAVAALMNAGTYSAVTTVTQNNNVAVPLPAVYPPSSGLSGGAIAGIVIGCVVFAALVVVFVIWMCKKKGGADSGKKTLTMQPIQNRAQENIIGDKAYAQPAKK